MRNSTTENRGRPRRVWPAAWKHARGWETIRAKAVLLPPLNTLAGAGPSLCASRMEGTSRLAPSFAPATDHQRIGGCRKGTIMCMVASEVEADVRRLFNEGQTKVSIAQQFAIDRTTVSKILQRPPGKPGHRQTARRPVRKRPGTVAQRSNGSPLCCPRCFHLVLELVRGFAGDPVCRACHTRDYVSRKGRAAA